MATKEAKREIKGLIEGLETRVHRGPPICGAEVHSVRDLLRQHDFSPFSEYFNRLTLIQDRLQGRCAGTPPAPAKRNYGGEAAGSRMQVLSVFDHVILSTCYGGQFNGQRGRIKISHRFNQHGRIDFVELKFLFSLHPPLNGAVRKLLLVKEFQSVQKDWHEAEAVVLRILPQELIFLFPDIFRCEKEQVFAWLLNIGHGIAGDLLKDLRTPNPSRAWKPNGDSGGVQLSTCQLDLAMLLEDDVALPILEKAAGLESTVEVLSPSEVVVRYLRTGDA
jgi:hypothetical protein